MPVKQHPNNPPKSFNFSAYKALIPLLLSILVAYTISKDISIELIQSIPISSKLVLFILLAIAMFIIRDLNYVMRLRLLTNKMISWFKLVQIVFLWEFASSITPSAFGGPIAAVFLLQREKITLGKSTSIILISAFLDELVFILVLPIMYLLVGDKLFELSNTCFENGTFSGLVPYLKSIIIGIYVFLLVVFFVLYYGLFVNANSLNKAYQFLAKLPIVNRWNQSLLKAGEDILLASDEVKSKTKSYWIQAFLFTLVSWSARYILAFFVIAALAENLPNLLDVYSKLYFIRALSILPLSPGGIGVSEWSFLALLCTYLPFGLTKIATLIWRFLSYHIYLLLGVVMIPVYFNKNNHEKI